MSEANKSGKTRPGRVTANSYKLDSHPQSPDHDPKIEHFVTIPSLAG